MAADLFNDLKDVLQEFKDFLDDKVPVITPAVQALKTIIPDQINSLLDLLSGLMTKLKTEIQNLDVSAIPGLADAAEFMERIKAFVTAAKALLPDDASDFDAVTDAADVIGSLPSLDDVKDEIIALIDAISAHLNTLKAA
jgi:phage-related protein